MIKSRLLMVYYFPMLPYISFWWLQKNGKKVPPSYHHSWDLVRAVSSPKNRSGIPGVANLFFGKRCLRKRCLLASQLEHANSQEMSYRIHFMVVTDLWL